MYSRCCSCPSQRYAYLLWPHPVHRSCAMHPVELYWLRACGLQRGSEVSSSVDRPPVTVCRLHYEHQSCHRTLLCAMKTHLFSSARHRWETSRDSGAEYKYTYLLTYLHGKNVKNCDTCCCVIRNENEVKAASGAANGGHRGPGPSPKRPPKKQQSSRWHVLWIAHCRRKDDFLLSTVVFVRPDSGCSSWT